MLLDDWPALLRGVVLGLVLAAPVGPIGLLCIRRTLERGIFVGIGTGLGAAVADAFYAAVAAFGISAVMSLLYGYDWQIRLFGGVFMIVAGAYGFWKAVPPKSTTETGAADIIGATASGLILTLTNPVTIIAILAVVATFGGHPQHLEAGLLVTGVFFGSLLWWLFLCAITRLIRHSLSERTIIRMNQIMALLLLALGLWAVSSVPSHL